MTSYGGFGTLHAPYGDRGSTGARIYASISDERDVGQAEDESPLQRDAMTLARFLSPVPLPPEASVAAVVFGAQARRLTLSLEHAANLLYERTLLHERLLADIGHRHLQVHDQLYGARLQGKLDDFRRADRLEGMLLQLDEQRRKEELAFWKDTAEVREALFEQAGEYGALRHRTALLEGLEPGGPADG